MKINQQNIISKGKEREIKESNGEIIETDEEYKQI